MRPALIWLAGLWSIEAQSCVDDATWFSSRGNCASYAVGQPNNAYCSTDGATTRCPRSCQLASCNSQIAKGGACSTTSNNCAPGLYCKLGLCVEGTVTGDYYNNNNVASTSGVAAYTGGISVYSAAQPPIAGQKDIHGCRNGMGEFWCESQNACLYYTIPCMGIPRGPSYNGCGDGYWCPVKNRCINPAFEACSPIPSGPIGVDQYGCQISQGYVYCSSLNRCIQASRESCLAPSNRFGDASIAVGGADSNGCYIGGGYSWCATKSKCIRTWEESCDNWVPTSTEDSSTGGYDPSAPITFGPLANSGAGPSGSTGFNDGFNGGFSGSTGFNGGFNGFTSGYFTRQPVSRQSYNQNYGMSGFGR